MSSEAGRSSTRGRAPGWSLSRRWLAAAAASLACALLLWPSPSGAGYPGDDPIEEYAINPCTGPDRRLLRCPNLRMSKPRDLFISISPSGRRLLHATSSVNSVGFGPLEVRGIRIPGTRLMRVNQRIDRRGGGKLSIRTEGRLAFYPIPGQYRYWKFRDAARFEIWTVDRNDQRLERVQTGPKFYYCFRDLFRTRPSNRSPGHRVYPGCSQDPGRRSIVLGTSVGWSDVYPADYHEQYINISGMRGCFAFYMEADPKNHIRETNEDDNQSRILIRLPSARPVGSC